MTLILLLILTAVAGVATLVGGVLIIVGWIAKKRGMRRWGAAVAALSVVVLVGCFTYASSKLVHKAKGAPGQAWRALVDAAFDDTAVKPVEAAKAKQILKGKLGAAAFLDGTEVQGVWVEGAMFSYGYFVYTAPQDQILAAVADAPIDTSFHLTSDSACRSVTWGECEKAMMYPEGPERNLAGWAPDKAAERRCYTCLRAPWKHTIVIDGKTGTVYHSISEIRD